MENRSQKLEVRSQNPTILALSRLPLYQLIEAQRLTLDHKYAVECDGHTPNATGWVQLITAQWIEIMEFDALNTDLAETQQFLKQVTRVAALAVAAMESARALSFSLLSKLPVRIDPNDPGIDLSQGPAWHCPICDAPNTAPDGAEVVECEACGGEFEVDLAAFPGPPEESR